MEFKFDDLIDDLDEFDEEFKPNNNLRDKYYDSEYAEREYAATGYDEAVNDVDVELDYCEEGDDYGVDELGYCEETDGYEDYGELRYYSEYESFKRAQELTDEFYDNKHPCYTKNTLQIIQNSNLPVYNELLDTDMSLMYRILINCQNEEFIQDYMDRLAARDLITDFETEHQMCEEDATDTLLHIINIPTEQEINDYAHTLYCLGDYCQNLFPKNFLCDVAVITAIRKLRDVAYRDDDYPGAEMEEFTSNPKVLDILADLRKGFRTYMMEDYTLDRVVKTMIMYCGLGGTEYDLEYYEVPQPSDCFVLEEVLHYMKSILRSEEIYFDAEKLHHILSCWLIEHGNEDEDEEWSDNFDKAWPGIRRLADWVCDKCTPMMP